MCDPVVVSCVILSSVPAVGGFIAGQRSFSARGGLFRRRLLPLARSNRSEESKSPRGGLHEACCRPIECRRTPRGARLQPFQNTPHPPPPSPPIPPYLVNSQHRHTEQKLKVPITADFQSHTANSTHYTTFNTFSLIIVTLH